MKRLPRVTRRVRKLAPPPPRSAAEPVLWRDVSITFNGVPFRDVDDAARFIMFEMSRAHGMS